MLLVGGKGFVGVLG